MVDCICCVVPHELWCPRAPAALSVRALREQISRAVEVDGVHESKTVAIAWPDGSLRAVASAEPRFARGQHLLVLTPTDPSAP